MTANTGGRWRNALLGSMCAITAIGALTLNAGGEAGADLAARSLGLPAPAPHDGAPGSFSTAGGDVLTAADTSGAGMSAGSSSASVLRRFAPLYMGNQQNYNSAQAVQFARDFDVIADQGGHLTPFLSTMRTTNPALRIVAYMNGAFDQSANGTTYPAAWYAHDAKGNRIRSRMFGNWLMDPTSPGWHGAVAGNCKALIASSHYDGCFLDTLGLGPLMPGYVTGIPVSPATHKAYTPQQWIAAQSATVAAAVSANGGKMMIANGLASGNKYFAGGGAATAPLLAAAHDAMSELWLRISRNPVNSYPAVSDWLNDVKMIQNAESHGWGVMTTTKLWVNATAAQQDAWHKFTLASFLLAAGGHSAYSFSTSSATAAIAATNSWDTVAVGNPTGAMVQKGNVYERQFSSGFVVVNPGTSAVTISFAGTYTSLSGSRVSSETLPPHSGDVLVG